MHPEQPQRPQPAATTAEATRRDLAAMRRAYASAALVEEDLAADPVVQFGRWFDEAVAAGLPEPNAMVLATAGRNALPSARTVLLKGYDERGFTFFSNSGSRKGRELAENPRAALLFPWHAMERQVRVEGPVEQLSRDVTEGYFRTRPRESQLGAWASDQSQVIPGRDVLELRVLAAAEKWGDETPVPLPELWTGYRVAVEAMEFWQGRESRLHDRLVYRRQTPAGGWVIERLAP